MATEIRPTSTLEPAIESVLDRLRRRIRAYVWADGIASLVVVLGLAFWLSLALDWLIEPPLPLRVALLLTVVVALGTVIYRQLISRLLVRLENRNMAVLLERRFRQFHDSLLTSVELAEQPEHAAEFNPDMLARAQHEARARAASVDLSQVFNARPLVRKVSLAAALVASAGVFAVAAPEALGVWARRTLLMSSELWPRYTRLMVDGFGEQRSVKIARGGDWNLVVRADAALGRVVPEVVEVRYSTSDGVRGRENMSREGVVNPGEAPFQPYAYTFKSVLAPLDFYVVGGDDRQGPYHLDVVDSPTISRMLLRCQYPAYTGRASRDIPVAGLMQVPRGTHVTIVAEANKPLVSVQIDEVADESTPITHKIDLAAEHGGPQQNFQFALPQLDADKTLLFTLRDSDGIRSRDAVRLTLSAIADEPPQVSVTLKGIGTAVTPEARLPATGEVADDYGVARVWFDYHLEEAPSVERPLNVAATGQEKLPINDVLELAELKLVPKQKLHWTVKAADASTLAGGPNVGTGQNYVLDVVTPEQLRSMLEARELLIRRRFETIIAELTDTRELLAGIAFQPPAEKPAVEKPAADKPAADKPVTGEAEKTDAAANSSGMTSAVQVERVIQNVERAHHETTQVAIAFDDIREEMINNRIDTEELKTRLKDGVSDPLKRIVTERYLPLEERLRLLPKQAADPAQAVKTQASAVAETDALLVELKQVLDKMLELETFNEVLDTLRQIIESQEKVNERTKQQQKSKLRDLIE